MLTQYHWVQDWVIFCKEKSLENRKSLRSKHNRTLRLPDKPISLQLRSLTSTLLIVWYVFVVLSIDCSTSGRKWNHQFPRTIRYLVVEVDSEGSEVNGSQAFVWVVQYCQWIICMTGSVWILLSNYNTHFAAPSFRNPPLPLELTRNIHSFFSSPVFASVPHSYPRKQQSQSSSGWPTRLILTSLDPILL